MARNSKTKQISVARGFGKGKDGADALVAAYDHYKGEDMEIAIHCRIGTSGIKDIRNTHPFEIHNGLWLMHNGVINKADRSSDLQYCDTYHFAKGLEAWAGDGATILSLIQEPQNTAIIEDFIGYSKLLFLDSEHGFVLINEDLGEWKNGLWYSNDSLWTDFTWHGSTKVARSLGSSLRIEEDADEREFWANYRWQNEDEDFCGLHSVTPRSQRIKSRKAELRCMGRVLQDVKWTRELNVDQIAEECLENPDEMAEMIYALLHSATQGMTEGRVKAFHRDRFFKDLMDARYPHSAKKTTTTKGSTTPALVAVANNPVNKFDQSVIDAIAKNNSLLAKIDAADAQNRAKDVFTTDQVAKTNPFAEGGESNRPTVTSHS